MVLANTAANGEELVADAHLLSTTAVGQKNGDEIKRYLLSDRNPTATILIQGTTGLAAAGVGRRQAEREKTSAAQRERRRRVGLVGSGEWVGWVR
ncbi:Subtilisin-like protease SBT1.7 [Linum perenne]